MTQLSKVTGVATNIYTDDHGALCVRYHKTVVAKRQGDTITLDTGGWRTATTKVRMNQFANQHCDGAFHVYQDGGEWFVRRRITDSGLHGKAIPFNGETITFSL